jgi:signal transduction histidine kinase
MRIKPTYRDLLICLPILLIGVSLSTALHRTTQAEQGHALERYRASATSQTRTVSQGVETKLDHIYTNLRTLALLPGVKKIDRHAKNVDDDTRTTFQQIYNNLAASVDISEVYIISEDFNPNRFDPVTLKNEEPILMFDELIVEGGANRSSILGQGEAELPSSVGPLQAEIEAEEYKQFVEVLSSYKKNYPSQSKIKGLNFPVRSGSPLITCDNRYFNDTLKDADRTGMTFSVPFYRADGTLGGVVAAIVLNRALGNMVPSQDFALVKAQSAFSETARADTTGQTAASAIWVKKAEIDPDLLYSEVIPLTFPESGWALWTGAPNDRFWTNSEMQSIQFNRSFGFPAVAIMTLAALAGLLMFDRNRRLALALEQEKLKVFSNLTAKFSYEIRNPLGSINNAVFIIRRMAGNDEKLLRQTTRAENAIRRCDKLISDMLAFGNPQEAVFHKADFADWLARLVGEYDFPPETSVQLEFHDEPLVAQFDDKQMTRVITSILENSIQAVPAGKATELQLSCGIQKGAIELVLRDKGGGIAPEALDRAFEPLFTTKNFGAGLGLPIAREIMRNHNGTLILTNLSEGGVKATLTLPLAASGEVVKLRRRACLAFS